jgi:hypothetical protein
MERFTCVHMRIATCWGKSKTLDTPSLAKRFAKVSGGANCGVELVRRTADVRFCTVILVWPGCIFVPKSFKLVDRPRYPSSRWKCEA